MKYLLTIYGDETRWENMSEEEGKRIMDAYWDFGDQAEKAGVLLGGEGLQPTATATTVRVRSGERTLTDGPFAESKEQLAGYYLLDCKDLDEAIGWAARIPGAEAGAVEVRPVMIYPETRERAERSAEGAAS
jgi:hypothetical protein